MNLDRTPLPRFWYLPRGEKAAVVMTGDDHAHTRGTVGPVRPLPGRQPERAARSPTGSACASTSYVFPAPPTDAQAARLPGRGLRDRAAPQSPNCPTATLRAGGSLDDDLTTQLDDFAASVAEPRRARAPAGPTASSGATGRASRRSSCSTGSASTPTTTTGPAAWVQDRPGMFTGSGFPMRFADARRLADRRLPGGDAAHRRVGHRHRRRTSGALLDERARARRLLRRLHRQHAHRHADNAGADAIVKEAQRRGVPVVSAEADADLARRP